MEKKLAQAIAEEANETVAAGPQCGVLKIRKQLGDESYIFDNLLDEVREGTRTGTSVSRILAKIGITYSGNNINRHIRGECRCPKILN